MRYIRDMSHLSTNAPSSIEVEVSSSAKLLFMGDPATSSQYDDCCRIVRCVVVSETSLYSEVVAHWQEVLKVVEHTVGSVLVKRLTEPCTRRHRLEGQVESCLIPRAALVLLPMCRRSVPVDAITEAAECTPLQHPSVGTAMKNPWRRRQT